MYLFLLNILYILCEYTEGDHLDLSGKWILQNRNGSIVVNEALVPGYVHTALLKANVIDDPYFRNNDEVYRWIDYDDWTYSKTFDLEDTLLSKTSILLICEGLDTVADVYINTVSVGQSTNMFQRYVWDIKKALVTGGNKITIKFTSAVTYSAYKSKLYNYTIPPNCPPSVQHGECHVNLIRKKQCSFSWSPVHSSTSEWLIDENKYEPEFAPKLCRDNPVEFWRTFSRRSEIPTANIIYDALFIKNGEKDWGPAFASQGIWKNISIQAFDSALIKDVLVNTIKANSSSVSWYLKVTVVIDCGSEESMGSVVATLPRFGVASKAMVHCTMSSATQVYLPTITLLDDEHGVRTWWPRGYGSQPLYDLTVTYKDTQTFEISTKKIRIGFREVKLVQEQITGGLSFYYKVNDVAIFMKGANWIPADAFEDRVTNDVIRNILQSSADANMNIVRNWGGGIYQHDSFYSIADELGLLIWQEFMFACDYYPADEQFLDSVRKEVTHQIQRLQYHPSVLIWSGNNEIESSVSQNWYGVKNLTLYKENYVKLFIDTIRSTVLGLDSSRPFVSSSPSDGAQTEKEGWISSNPNSDFYGDVHYYNYTMDCLDIRGYPQPRFASEYGLQSLPRFQTLSSVTVKDDWSYFSPIMMHRQHHGSGNEQMLSQTKMHFKIPNSADPLEQFKDMLYLTQASQAICIKAESEHYRRLRSVMNEGRGHTMGAIYWQLNSIWPAPTWSSLEYGGRWKMLHYYAKDFFSPIIISPFEFNNTLYIFAVSDLLQNVELKLTVNIWSWQMIDDPVTTITMWTKVPAQSSVKVWQKDIDNLFKLSSCKDRSHCVVTFSSVPDGENDTPDIPTNVFYFTSLADAQLLNPNIQILNISLIPFNEFLITLKSTALAPFVWLESGDIPGRFSDNGFLITQQFTQIVFYCWQPSIRSVDDLKQALTVSSLYDVYTEPEFTDTVSVRN